MKKKGFTLVELLVAIACTTLVAGMVFSTVYFISRVNGDLLEKSSDLYRLSSLDDVAKEKTTAEFQEILNSEYSDILPEGSYSFDTVNGTPTFTYTYDDREYSFVYAPKPPAVSP